MAYTPPVYDNVNVDFTESGYTPPAYNAVNVEFGGGVVEYTLFLAFNF